MEIGDPNTRPEEEMVFVLNFYDLEHDARDWEGCMLVPWAMHLPRGVGARDIENLLLAELQLHRGDVTVTGRGIDICLRCWRSLIHALGMRIFFRVKLYLNGIPGHAWMPDIVECIIGSYPRTQGTSTSRRGWPTRQGLRYEVFLHWGLLEDYTTATHDLQGAIANPTAFAPLWRLYVWCYGVMDGAPADARSKFLARLLLLPREQDQVCPDTRTRAQDDRERDSGQGAGFDDYPHPGCGGYDTRRAGERRDNNAVRCEWTRSPRQRDVEFRGGHRRSCNSTPPATPPTHHGAFPPTITPRVIHANLAQVTGLNNGMQALLGEKQDCWMRDRHHRTFDMTKVRRSARLAKKPSMLAVERAQQNLWHKLGVSNDDFWPIEEVLQEFISMFAGPLLE
uniref:Uncharacterized protein n=1 Tax=Setaria viridis TaxID=4556 RepID=A0A4V6D6S9_SETVI|nr:hypothetical protein SEVIR_5G225400v2 [Setaria viridis]